MLLQKKPNPQEGGFIALKTLEEHQIEAMSIQGEKLVAVTAASDYSAYYLECFDLGEGIQLQSNPMKEFLTDIGFDKEGNIWVSAHWGWNDINAAKPGLYVTDMQNCQLLEPELELSLAPMGLIFLQE